MSPATWDPFRSFTPAFREMDNAFASAKGSWNPRTTVSETKEGDLMITAEMPGLAKEDVKIDLQNGMLTIKGSQKTEEKKEGSYTKQKRSYFR